MDDDRKARSNTEPLPEFLLRCHRLADNCSRVRSKVDIQHEHLSRPIQSSEYNNTGLLQPLPLASCSLHNCELSCQSPRSTEHPASPSSTHLLMHLVSNLLLRLLPPYLHTQRLSCLVSPSGPPGVTRSADPPFAARSHRSLLRLASHNSQLLRSLPAF